MGVHSDLAGFALSHENLKSALKLVCALEASIIDYLCVRTSENNSVYFIRWVVGPYKLEHFNIGWLCKHLFLIYLLSALLWIRRVVGAYKLDLADVVYVRQFRFPPLVLF